MVHQWPNIGTNQYLSMMAFYIYILVYPLSNLWNTNSNRFNSHLHCLKTISTWLHKSIKNLPQHARMAKLDGIHKAQLLGKITRSVVYKLTYYQQKISITLVQCHIISKQLFQGLKLPFRLPIHLGMISNWQWMVSSKSKN